jgi:cell division protein FtsA
MLPQEFSLDDQSGVHDPIGLQARSLAVQVHLVTGSVAASQGVVTAVNRAGIVVETVVAEALAVGECVLTPEERELGSIVILLGGGSTELAAYMQGGLWMSSGIPVGGDHFTNDIAIGLHTPPPEAETIKTMFGSVFSSWNHEGVSFEVPGLARHPGAESAGGAGDRRRGLAPGRPRSAFGWRGCSRGRRRAAARDV